MIDSKRGLCYGNKGCETVPKTVGARISERKSYRGEECSTEYFLPKAILGRFFISIVPTSFIGTKSNKEVMKWQRLS